MSHSAGACAGLRRLRRDRPRSPRRRRTGGRPSQSRRDPARRAPPICASPLRRPAAPAPPGRPARQRRKAQSAAAAPTSARRSRTSISALRSAPAPLHAERARRPWRRAPRGSAPRSCGCCARARCAGACRRCTARSVGIAQQVGERARQRRHVAVREGTTARADRFGKSTPRRAHHHTAAGDPFKGDDPERLVVARRDDQHLVPVEQADERLSGDGAAEVDPLEQPESPRLSLEPRPFGAVADDRQAAA